MIILDTHIWVWYAQGDSNLKKNVGELIRRHESTGLGICAISLWEIAKAVELRRLVLPTLIDKWFAALLVAPGVNLLPLTPAIAVESTQLPGTFHKDPFDQLIVATARIYDVPLVTADSDIRKYPHVKLLP